MALLTDKLTRPFRRAQPPGESRRIAAVRRELDAAEAGELLLDGGPGHGPVTISWQRHGRPPLALAGPYRLERVELRGSHRARLHGLTAGIRLVCPDWSPLFLISPSQLPVLACVAASSRLAATP